MEINKIKKEMLAYKDFYGGDIPDRESITKATSKKELAEVLERHRHMLEDMLSDAHRHLDNFKEKLGLRMI